MSTTAIASGPPRTKQRTADDALIGSGKAWFLVALIGQLLFALYVVLFYGRAAAGGDFDRWNDVLVGGYVHGGALGNAVLGSHLLLAFTITVGGPLQLLPGLRVRAPAFHRWNGRIYVLTAVLISLGGLYMVWTRGTAGGLAMRVGISLNGVLIVACAALAWRHALMRDFGRHRVWAMRLFVLVSGVWFFRVGLMLWILANGGPVGLGGPGFDGPFVRFLAFACYLLPLGVLELYLRAQSSRSSRAKFAVSGFMVVATFATGAGVLGATLGMWAPLIH